LRAEDPDIWRHATRSSAAIVTKDEDFPKLKALNSGGPQVVWLRVGNCSNRALLAWFTPLLPDVIDRLNRGEGLIEVV
jgi:predicted nuclease of predicted toxin-antitoxin system